MTTNFCEIVKKKCCQSERLLPSYRQCAPPWSQSHLGSVQQLPDEEQLRWYNQGQTGRVFQLRVGFGYWKNISGRVGLGIGYLYQIPSQLGIMGYWNLDQVFALFPILSNIYYLIWLIWSIKHVFSGQIYVIVVQCGRSWQPFGDCRKSQKPLESVHLQNFGTKMPYL